VAAFYAEDHLGSIRDLRMGDGQVLASYDYEPYGAPTRADETGGVTADYRYAGLVNHAPSGLYLAHYRAYSPTTGRWMSRDPIFEAGGVNLYAYVGNNPVNGIDPSGLVKLYGSWCGPNWTGGFRKSYDELDATERSIVLPPTDNLDRCCQVHDIAYADCRARYSCDAEARKTCFKEADRRLSSCSAGAGGGQSPMILLFGNPQKRIEEYMRGSSPSGGP
jgi:RHS repeat-associated protein